MAAVLNALLDEKERPQLSLADLEARPGIGRSNLSRLYEILEIVRMNSQLNDASLCPAITKPFDVLVEGLVSEKIGGGRTPIELFFAGVETWGHAEIAVLTGVYR